MSNVSFGDNARFQCACGQPIYFRNTKCLHCGRELGYDPQTFQLYTLTETLTPLVYVTLQTNKLMRRCINFGACDCNWLLPESSQEALCFSCRLTRTIPNLSVLDNSERWTKVEIAKRRLVAQLLSLKLPIPNRMDHPNDGLIFDLLGADVDNNMPITGHANGVITINVHEADDDYRARVRTNMDEHYRTVLGHLRHEVGHFYWDLLVRKSQWLEGFRELFGDEQVNYSEALAAYYKKGAPEHWQTDYISAYASMHPWEDWAETWAHYLHMMDALNVAKSFGIQLTESRFDLMPFTVLALYAPDDHEAQEFLQLVNHWVELTHLLNALARSIGQLDVYPFFLSMTVVAKLQFVHLLVRHHGKPPSLDIFEYESGGQDHGRDAV